MWNTRLQELENPGKRPLVSVPRHICIYIERETLYLRCPSAPLNGKYRKSCKLQYILISDGSHLCEKMDIPINKLFLHYRYLLDFPFSGQIRSIWNQFVCMLYGFLYVRVSIEVGASRTRGIKFISNPYRNISKYIYGPPAWRLRAGPGRPPEYIWIYFHMAWTYIGAQHTENH